MRTKGTVLSYRRSGYAWIESGGRQIFLHVTDSNRTVLHCGDVVEFTLIETPKGPRAKQAVVVETVVKTEACPSVNQG